MQSALKKRQKTEHPQITVKQRTKRKTIKKQLRKRRNNYVYGVMFGAADRT